jgi:hypothetical protein
VDGPPRTATLHELRGVIVGSNGHAGTRVFLNTANAAKIELDSGAFEDWVIVEFDCEGAVGLVKKRYSYCNVYGLRDL